MKTFTTSIISVKFHEVNSLKRLQLLKYCMPELNTSCRVQEEKFPVEHKMLLLPDKLQCVNVAQYL